MPLLHFLSRRFITLVPTMLYAMLCVMLFTHTTMADSPQLSIDAPTMVKQGHGFMLTIASQPPLPMVHVTWGGQIFPLTLKTDGLTSHANLLLGMPYDAQNEKLISVHSGKIRTRARIKHQKVVWETEAIQVDKKYVTPPANLTMRIQKERAATKAILARVTQEQYYEQLPFVRPVKGIVTSGYGKKRLLNGETKSIHRGTDFRGATGVPIKAMAGGVIALTDKHYFSGNTILIDHGLGLISLYAHLSAVHVKTGATVKAGEIIGLIGASGRVTGSHLHLAVYNFAQAINPMPLFLSPPETTN